MTEYPATAMERAIKMQDDVQSEGQSDYLAPPGTLPRNPLRPRP
jgi:hypothetical protein